MREEEESGEAVDTEALLHARILDDVHLVGSSNGSFQLVFCPESEGWGAPASFALRCVSLILQRPFGHLDALAEM